MLPFYALLFFLFSTSAVAAPVLLGLDGYWVLKKPSHVENRFSGTVLKIEGKKRSTFKLDKDFKIVPQSEHVVQEPEMQDLEGVWHAVPFSNSQRGDCSAELHIVLDPEQNPPTMRLRLDIPPVSLKDVLPGPSGSLPPQGSLNGYWVLGDTIDSVGLETWRKIWHVEGGKYFTFELDHEFNIISLSRKEVDQLLPGDYFRIPFEGMKDRFAVLEARKEEGKIVQYLSKCFTCNHPQVTPGVRSWCKHPYAACIG